MGDLCKKGLTDRDAVFGADSCVTKDWLVVWGSNTFYTLKVISRLYGLPKNHVLDGSLDFPGKGALLRGDVCRRMVTYLHMTNMANLPAQRVPDECKTAMRFLAKLL